MLFSKVFCSLLHWTHYKLACYKLSQVYKSFLRLHVLQKEWVGPKSSYTMWGAKGFSFKILLLLIYNFSLPIKNKVNPAIKIFSLQRMILRFLRTWIYSLDYPTSWAFNEKEEKKKVGMQRYYRFFNCLWKFLWLLICLSY